MPTRRATATAIRNLLAKGLGGAGSPFIVGVMIEYFKNEVLNPEGVCKSLPDSMMTVQLNQNGSITSMTVCEANINFYAIQYSLYVNVAVVFIGAVLFFLAGIWILQDKDHHKREGRAEVHNLNRF